MHVCVCVLLYCILEKKMRMGGEGAFCSISGAKNIRKTWLENHL